MEAVNHIQLVRTHLPAPDLPQRAPLTDRAQSIPRALAPVTLRALIYAILFQRNMEAVEPQTFDALDAAVVGFCSYQVCVAPTRRWRVADNVGLRAE